jgi:hypothetical protein
MSRRSGRRRAGTNRGVLALAGLVLGLAVTACSSDGSNDASNGSGDAAADVSAPTETAAPGSGLLEVSARAIGGGDVDLRQYEGKPLVLWFWAPG